uniref:Guanylate cyclase domain-containing protein n=1 Tax=Schistocephalus solidus TaxID=70667 RepID=A0A183SL08_SCHSO
LLHGPDGFVERGREIEVGVGLHFSQSITSDAGDDGVVVEDAFEMLDRVLQNLRLLRGSVSAESMSASFGFGTIDTLDRSAEVLPFVMVRVPLNFLGLVSHPGILHFRSRYFMRR